MKVKAWLDTIERNTPTNYPHLSCGWPDEEHGITWDSYICDLIKKLECWDEGEPKPHLPLFEEWKDMRRSVDEYRDDLGFSHIRCELCGSAPGDRHAVTALPDNPAENHDYVALSVCGDCLCFIANGDVPDWLEDD